MNQARLISRIEAASSCKEEEMLKPKIKDNQHERIFVITDIPQGCFFLQPKTGDATWYKNIAYFGYYKRIGTH